MTQDPRTVAADTRELMDRASAALDRLAERPEAHSHLAEIGARLKTSIEYELVELEKIAEMLGIR